MEDFTSWSNVEWSDETIERAAAAIYTWRSPITSGAVPFSFRSDGSQDRYSNVAIALLDAADVGDSGFEEWDLDSAAEVYYAFSYEGTTSGRPLGWRLEFCRNWYRDIAKSIINAAIHDLPVDNSKLFSTRRRCSEESYMFDHYEQGTYSGQYQA